MKDRFSKSMKQKIPLLGFSVEAALMAFIGILLALALYKWVGIPLLAPYGKGAVKVAGILVGVSCVIYGIITINKVDKYEKTGHWN